MCIRDSLSLSLSLALSLARSLADAHKRVQGSTTARGCTRATRATSPRLSPNSTRFACTTLVSYFGVAGGACKAIVCGAGVFVARGFVTRVGARGQARKDGEWGRKAICHMIEIYLVTRSLPPARARARTHARMHARVHVHTHARRQRHARTQTHTAILHMIVIYLLHLCTPPTPFPAFYALPMPSPACLYTHPMPCPHTHPRPCPVLTTRIVLLPGPRQPIRRAENGGSGRTPKVSPLPTREARYLVDQRLFCICKSLPVLSVLLTRVALL
eukprot:3815742-Rhodomonas_salina.1